MPFLFSHAFALKPGRAVAPEPPDPPPPEPEDWGLPSVEATRFRIFATAPFGSSTGTTVSLAEFYLLDEDGEPIDRTGAVATALHDWGGSETPDKVVDDDTGTHWAGRTTGSGSPGYNWIEIEMPDPVTVRGFGMAPRGTDGTNIKDFTFEYHDGDDWVQWGPAFVETFLNLGITKWYGPFQRWWRVYCTASSTSHAGLAEIQFREELGVPELHNDGIPFALGRWGASEGAPQAFDDNPSTHWGMSGFPSWVGYRFPGQKQVEEVLLQVRSDNSSAMPTEFEIQYSDDLGLTWEVAASGARQLTATTSEIRLYEIGWHSLIMTTNNADSSGWDGYTIRQRVSASILDREGSHVRLTFRNFRAGTHLNVSKVSIGLKGSGNFDFKDDPIALTFNGSPGFELDGDVGEVAVSDPIPLAIDGEDDLIIAFLISTSDSVPHNTGSYDSVFSRAYKNADEVMGPLVASGYSTGGTSTTFVREIEVGTPAKMHTDSEVFLSSGNFTVPTGVTSVDVLIVGGGGGGGSRQGSGGGGAGRVRYIENVSVTPDDVIPVIVGDGGAGGSSSAAQVGQNGGNSSFDDLVSEGGGGGGPFFSSGSTSGASGGSGGGAGPSSTAYSGGDGISPGGNDGGSQPGTEDGGGGGGGAGEVGGDRKSNGDGGDGGDGLDFSSIFGTGVGDNGWFGGGGGGGLRISGSTLGNITGAGGEGGGGNGGAYQSTGSTAGDGEPGMPNTGGGGGGCRGRSVANRAGGDGGSGIVIVAWNS